MAGAKLPLEKNMIDRQTLDANPPRTAGVASQAELAAFFGAEEWAAAKSAPVTHEEVWYALRGIKGSLSDAISEMRREGR